VDKSLSLLFDDDDGIPSTRPERSLAYRKSSALARFFPEETSRLDDEEVLSISAVGLNRYLDEYARISSGEKFASWYFSSVGFLNGALVCLREGLGRVGWRGWSRTGGGGALMLTGVGVAEDEDVADAGGGVGTTPVMGTGGAPGEPPCC